MADGTTHGEVALQSWTVQNIWRECQTLKNGFIGLYCSSLFFRSYGTIFSLSASVTFSLILLQEKRYPVDGVERIQLQKCLDTLQNSIRVTTLSGMVERLESISRQLGLVFCVFLSFIC